jgi:hypothetical protein
MRECKHCGKEFKPRFGTEKFCSTKCSGLAKRTPRYKTNCEQCGKEFEVREYLYKVKKKRFCSRECVTNSMRTVTMETRVCAWCKEEYEIPSNKKTTHCSTDCSNKTNALNRRRRRMYNEYVQDLQDSIDLGK